MQSMQYGVMDAMQNDMSDEKKQEGGGDNRVGGY